MAIPLTHQRSPAERIFRPSTVAVLGDTIRSAAPARILLHNLRSGGFDGAVLPVGSGAAAVAGVLGYPDIASLPLVPDLAVLALPPDEVAGSLAALAARGAGGAIVTGPWTPQGKPPLPMLGAGSFGVIVPGLWLNASFATEMPRTGNLALVCQSAGFARAVLDHAATHGLGFSHVVTLGQNDDMGFAAVLDWLSRDGATRTVLLEVARIKDRRGFLSAARALTRSRVVLALDTAPGPASSPDSDMPLPAVHVFDAALRRAGVLAVSGLEEMLAAMRTLSRGRRMAGGRVVVVSTSTALGALAERALAAGAIALPPIDAHAASALSSLLPAAVAAANPMILPDDAPPNRLGEVIACLAGSADAVLCVHAPGSRHGEADGGAVAAEAVIAAHAAARSLPIVAAWAGGAAAVSARARLEEAGLPCFSTPEGAARAIRHLVEQYRSREAARELPARRVAAASPDHAAIRAIFARSRAEGRTRLTEQEAFAVLNACGIATVPMRVVADAEDAAEAATALGFPVVLKIRAPGITHRSAIGGVTLDLESEAAVRAAAEAMAARIARTHADVRITGFVVQRQVRRAQSQELAVQVTRDARFGPVMAFGHGGSAAAVIADIAADLPPLNRSLAAALVARTRVARLLTADSPGGGCDREAVHETLVRAAELAVAFPDLAALTINPLIANEFGLVALDARITIDAAPGSGDAHLAIAPYPAELAQQHRLKDGRCVTLRPIRPEDADAHTAFFARLTPEDVRARFFAPIAALSPEQIARMTQIDYDREMAIIACAEGDDGTAETLGVVRIICDPDSGEGEFAVVVRSDCKGSGLGTRLMQAGIAWARAQGMARLVGDVLGENTAMIGFITRLGFTVARNADDPELMRATLAL